MAEKKNEVREHPKAAAVRKAAGVLADAVGAAEAAGFVVTWPTRAVDAASILISETGRVVEEGEEPAIDPLLGTVVETQPVTTV